MAQAFSSPEGIPAPEFSDFLKDGYDSEGYDAACAEHIERVREWALANTDSNSPLVGKVVHLGPVGDGYAIYMVWRTKPLSLLHLPHGDAWNLSLAHMRGLRLKDIQEHVEFQERWHNA